MIEGCKHRSHKAQQALYELYAGKMLGVCLRYVHCRETARDLLHDGFVTVFSKIDDFRGDGSFDGWVRRIFVTTSLGYLRKNSNWSDVEDERALNNLQSEEISVLDKISANELLEIMGRMPEKYRAVLNLYAIEGYSHHEISDMTGISENTSRSQYSRARAILLKLMSDGAR